MKQQYLIQAFFLMIFICCAHKALAQSHERAPEIIVHLGHAAPMTGPIAYVGKDLERGALLAVDELNQQGIIIGGQRVKFGFLIEDDAGDPKQATAVAQKFVDRKVAAVIGHLQSGTSIPASKIYHNARIPQISAGTTNPKYTQQKFDTTFRVTANDAQLGSRLGTYAVETLHAKKIAVIDDKTAYGQGLAKEFIRSAKVAGAQIVAREYTSDKTPDFGAILTSIKAKSPDVIFFGGLDAGAGALLRDMKRLGFPPYVRLMGGDAVCTTTLPELAADSLSDDKVICAEAGGVEALGQAALIAFKKKFKRRYGEDVVIYASYTYDATMLVAYAMKKANSVDPRVYIKTLAASCYEGVTGKICFDQFGDIRDAALTLYTYKNGKRSLLKVIRNKDRK